MCVRVCMCVCRTLGVSCVYPPTGGDWVRIPAKQPTVPVAMCVKSGIQSAMAEQYPQYQPSGIGDGTEWRAPHQARGIVSSEARIEDLALPVPQACMPVAGLLLGSVKDGVATDFELRERHGMV